VSKFFLGVANWLSAYGANELRADHYWLTAGLRARVVPASSAGGQQGVPDGSLWLAKAYNAPGASRLAWCLTHFSGCCRSEYATAIAAITRC